MRAGQNVGPDDAITLKDKPRFVSRGGEKLDHALDAFGVDVTGMVVADLGASTGGFGAVWAQADLRRILARIGARVLDAELAVTHAHTGFDDDMLESLADVVNDLVSTTHARELAAA